MPVTIMWEEDDGSVGCVALDIYEEETYNWPTTVTTHPVETGGMITDQVQIGNPKLTVAGYVTNKPGPSNYLFYGALVEGYDRDETANGSYKSTELTIQNSKEYKFNKVELDVPGKKLRANVGALLAAGFNALFPTVNAVDSRVVSVIKERKIQMQAWTLDDPGKSRIGEVLTALVGLNTGRRRCNVISDLYSLTDCVISDLSVPKKVDDGEGAPFSVTFEKIRTVFAKTVEAPVAAPALQKKKEAGSKATEYSGEYADERQKTLASLIRTSTGELGLLPKVTP